MMNYFTDDREDERLVPILAKQDGNWINTSRAVPVSLNKLDEILDHWGYVAESLLDLNIAPGLPDGGIAIYEHQERRANTHPQPRYSFLVLVTPGADSLFTFIGCAHILELYEVLNQLGLITPLALDEIGEASESPEPSEKQQMLGRGNEG